MLQVDYKPFFIYGLMVGELEKSLT